jgi:hypothetical protein
MPIPFVAASDDVIFKSLNGVMIGWLLLAFLPRWRYTSSLTLVIGAVYALLYAVMSVPALSQGRPVNFSSLTGVATMFAERDIVMLGWVHYISYDLLIARWCVQDAIAKGISHLLVAPLLPLMLMAGPIGLCAYLLVRVLHQNVTGRVVDVTAYALTAFCCFFSK